MKKGFICLVLAAALPAFADQYSSNAEITNTNVANLKRAFSFHTGDLNQDFADKGHSFQATPVYWNGLLYVSTSSNVVVAVDAGTGKEAWRFDAKIDRQWDYAEHGSRGVSIWHAANLDQPQACAHRILLGTLSSKLIAIDALTGKKCAGFGVDGEIDLSEGVRNFRAGEYTVTSPVAVLSDRVIVGSAIGDNGGVEMENGIVRAYDVRSGELLWHWDPIPRDKDNPAYKSWAGKSGEITGAANAWAPISVDESRHLAFIPTSSPSPDFYGGERKGSNRHANSLVALNTNTGKVVWAQQLVHHDVWDYDTPARPNLTQLKRDGKLVDAVVQVTKTGMVFAFNRDDGTPLFEIEERPVPASDAEGELTHATQPFSSVSLIKTTPLTRDDAFGLVLLDKHRCADKIEQYRNEGMFTPPSVKGSLQYPAWSGGMNWGGIATDPKRQIGIVNFSQVAGVVKLIPRRDVERVIRDREMPGWQVSRMRGTPYGMARQIFFSDLGMPCTRPPWGSIAGIDLETGEEIWRKPFGTIQDFAPGPVPNFEWGMPSLGGPLVTAGGVTFIGASLDFYFRALDSMTGEELWRHRLQTSANAIPMSYLHEGKQYVAIAVGGHGAFDTPKGDEVIVFSL